MSQSQSLALPTHVRGCGIVSRTSSALPWLADRIIDLRNSIVFLVRFGLCLSMNRRQLAFKHLNGIAGEPEPFLWYGASSTGKAWAIQECKEQSSAAGKLPRSEACRPFQCCYKTEGQEEDICGTDGERRSTPIKLQLRMASGTLQAQSGVDCGEEASNSTP